MALQVLYCAVCGLPAEFCEYGPSFEACKPWLIQHCPELYPHLVPAAPTQQPATAATDAEASAGGSASGSTSGSTSGGASSADPSVDAGAVAQKVEQMTIGEGSAKAGPSEVKAPEPKPQGGKGKKERCTKCGSQPQSEK
eukprot:TRINITY_DN3460_c0_g1_i2.p1 TRINITY_DN3460_c0_g1~~TRINITY_DN3460_c0_g1_i2.p1  ORF type:complete len:140 (+),score=26.87 TRINITY_DN3460_c0_g1_i2:62-481(+)